jgi:hypothetical protein
MTVLWWIIERNKTLWAFAKNEFKFANYHFIVNVIRERSVSLIFQAWPYKGRTEDKSFLYEVCSFVYVDKTKTLLRRSRYDYLLANCVIN